MKYKFHKDHIGWIGVICLLLAYFCMTIDVITSKSWQYNTLSLIGGISLAWRVWQDKNVPNLIFEIIFVMIAIANLVMFATA